MEHSLTKPPFTRSEVRFPSGAESLAAWLYRPTNAQEPLPCVVMGHGFTLTRNDGLPRVAQAFAEAGFAVLLFDYRRFGDSSGEPRQILDIAEQRDDFRAALAHARSLAFVDAERVILWGFSFGGGHALVVGEQDAQVAAVISVAPFVNGLANLRLTPWHVLFKAVGLALVDLVRALLGRRPLYVPASGEPGSFALLTAEESLPGYEAVTSTPGSTWRNQLAARVLLYVPFENPGGAAARLGVPVLMSVADQDQTVPPAAAVKAARRGARVELKRYRAGHFDMLTRREVLDDQVDFLRRRILGILPPRSEVLVEVDL